MERKNSSRRFMGLALTVVVSSLAGVAAASPQQAGDRTCLVCHDDAELKSSAGRPVYLDSKLFAASVHGRAGVGCVDCHADLAGFEDFPHETPLKPVTCANCHGDYARTSPGGVHGTSSPRLVSNPVLCKDCHGYHDVLPSSDPKSRVQASNRPRTCGACHAGASANFARGSVHERAPASGRSPAAIVRLLYKVLIGVMTGFFLLYVGADLLRKTRERWTKRP